MPLLASLQIKGRNNAPNPRSEAANWHTKRARMYALLEEQTDHPRYLESWSPPLASLCTSSATRSRPSTAASLPDMPPLNKDSGPNFAVLNGHQELADARAVRGCQRFALPAAEATDVSTLRASRAPWNIADRIQKRLDKAFGENQFRVKSAELKKAKLRQLQVQLRHRGMDLLQITASVIAPPDEENKAEICVGNLTLTWRLTFWNVVTSENWTAKWKGDMARVQHDGWEDVLSFSGSSHLPIFLTREVFEKSACMQSLEDFWQMYMLCTMDLKMSAGKGQQVLSPRCASE